ncbi:MAG: SH3 domain-containing protein [Candidatus Acidiferrum sp.]
MILRRISICLLFLLVCPLSVRAQQATINRNVILRRDPSIASPALEHLPKGARVTLVDQNPDSGFYHVRTEDDQVGWVFSRALTISQAPPTPAPPTPTPTPPADTNCDATLQSHVYHPARLIVKQQCIAVTGTFVDATAGKKPDGVRHEKDGDTHGWLKLDSEFQDLVNAGNISAEGGNLVFEIVCKYPVTQTDAKAACQGFTDHVTLPPVGSHVRIVGTYVQDTFHAQWMEIHPVTSITVIP